MLSADNKRKLTAELMDASKRVDAIPDADLLSEVKKIFPNIVAEGPATEMRGFILRANIDKIVDKY